MAQPSPWDSVSAPVSAQPQQQRAAPRLVVPAAPVATPQTVEQRNATVAGTNQTIQQTQNQNVPPGYRMGPNGVAERITGVPTTAQTAADTAYAPEYVAWGPNGGRADAMRGIQQIREALGTLRNYDVTGPVLGRLPDFLLDDSVINTRDTVQEVVQRNLRLVLGAQFTQEEGNRLIARAFDPRLDETTNIRRLESLLRQMEQAAAAKDSAAAYYEQNGTLNGWNGRLMTIDDFNPEANTEGQAQAQQAQQAPGQPGIADQPAERASPDAGRGGDASIPALDASWQARPLMDVAGALNYDDFYEVTEERGRVVMRPKVWGGDEEVRPMFFLQRSPNGRTYMRNADTGEESEVTAPDISQYRSEDGGIGQGLDAFVRGAADTASFGFADELSSAVGSDSYNDNLALNRAIDRYDGENGWSRLGGQLTGGFALTPLARAGSVAQATRQGAAMGGAYGLGSANGNVGDRLDDVAVGTAVGAGVGAAAQRFLGGRGGRGNANQAARRQEIVDVGTAARAEDVAVSRPIVDPAARDRAARVDAAFGNSGAVRTGYQGTADSIANRAADLGERGAATQGGQAVERGALGQRFRESFDRWRQTSRQYTTDLYDDASRLAGNPTFEANNMAQSLRSSIAELTSDGAQQNAAEIAFLQRYLDDLIDPASGQLRPRTIQNVRNTRTNLRGSVSEAGLQASQAEARVLRALDAAGDDIEAGIRAGSASRPAQGEAAIRAYRNADAVYRLRAETISDARRLILGQGNSPEQIVSNVQRLMGQGRGDSGRLATFLRTLQPEDRADFAATIAGSLGRKSPDAPFMLGQFMTHTSQMSDDAVRTVFGAEGLASIRNLRTVTQGLQRAQGRLNSSNTARVSSWGNARNQAIAAALGVGAGAPAIGGVSLGTGGVAGLAVAGGLLAARAGAVRLSERALMNPNITRFIRRASTANDPRAMRKIVNAFARSTQRDPALAQETLGLRTMLLQAANDNAGQVTRSAASPGNNEEKR